MVVKRGWALALLALGACAGQPPRPAPPPPVDLPAPATLDTQPAALRPPPAPPAADADGTGSMADRLDRLFAEDSRAEQALDPLGAMARGEAVPHDLLALVFTPELAARQRAVIEHTLTQLDRIDPAALDPPHRLSYAVFRQTLNDQHALLDPAAQALLGVQPFNHFMGFPVEFPEMAATGEGGSLRTLGEIEARLALERGLPLVFANAEARFREGIASGVVEPRLTVVAMIAEIDAILARPPGTSLFMVPVRHLPPGTPQARRRRIERAFLATTTEAVYPAYARLRRFLAETYLPAARDSVGLSALPGGAGLYRLLVRENTTLSLDPDVVHQTGLDEVARIQRAMQGVEGELGYTMPLHTFFDVIRTDRRFHPTSAEQLGQGFRGVGAKVTRLAPRYFLHLPRTPLAIRPYPEYRARFEAGGSYSEGLPDGSRPGVFWYNTYDWPHRFMTGITTLYLHEGAPGHHFQISLAQENDSLPDFQRFGGNPAYVEGWALYAETLGYDMGLYRDPLQHWGTLDDEMLRAMRLVVDTGLHTRGWTRDQAIAYMLDNSGIGRIDAAAEVDRYIANPGQALAYKVGAMTIQRLRDEARDALGARFDIREFHDQVLGSGALPLPVLEAKIHQWIADQAPASASAINARVLARP
ncbi:DUF885 family protein [Novosphingobium sp. FSW06-99]|uniref:DUF885 domain-containing protein n=1 Tax=Novosphingobium sp. FSW06-99 TaxID=1739113 RepID=UPI001E2DCCBE|nr:DUF885 domain-containing protein [Novosphingobium sp. FSW06-99]